MSNGADTRLYVPSDFNDTIDYQDGTGGAVMFDGWNSTSNQWAIPPGLDAVLNENASSDWGATQFTLQFRHSGITETFTKPADQLDTWAYLSSVTTRDNDTINYTYNSSNQLTSIKDSYGNTTTITWTNGYVTKIVDPTGRTYQYVQNGSGQLTEYIDPNNNGTYYTYDSYGNLTQIKTAAGNITKVAYDAGNTNRVTSITRLVHPTDSSGPTTGYQYAMASGTCPVNAGWTQTTATNPRGYVTTYCTDDLSRIRKVVDANGNGRSECYSNDGYANALVNGLNTLTTMSFWQGNTNDNPETIQQGGSNTQTCNGTTGGTGSGLTTTLGGYPATGNNIYLPTTVQDPQGNTTTYSYDASGNPLTIASGGAQSTLTYNTTAGVNYETLATSKDADGNTTTYTATNGNITKVAPPAGSGLTPINISYDSANRVKSVSSVSGSSGHEVDYTYDPFDRLAQEVFKNAAGSTVATITYKYDNDGNLLQRTDSAGTTTYGYDGLNRLTSQSFPDGTSDSYGYDPASNLTTLSDAGGTVSYGYDHANQLTSVTDPGASTATQLTYDNDGNLQNTTYPSGAAVQRLYNALGQLQTMTDVYKTSSGTTATLSFGLTYSGSLIHTSTDQAGNVTTYSYDGLNRLLDAKTTSGSSTVSDYGYTLDSNGNVLNASLNGALTSYAYNSGNEVCWQATGTYSNPTCGSAPNGAHAYAYDSDGNETSNGNGLTMTYNALQQLTGATSAGSTTTFGYLGSGQTELVASGANTLHNDILGLASQASAGSSTYFTRMPGGQRVDERTPSGTFNFLYDPQGSVLGLTDSAGHLAEQYKYDPYGNATVVSGNVGNPFGFQGGYVTGAGLVHFDARFYSPSDGRWTQQDPLNQFDDLASADRFSFASDDPINDSDPTGEATTCWQNTIRPCVAISSASHHWESGTSLGKCDYNAFCNTGSDETPKYDGPSTDEQSPSSPSGIDPYIKPNGDGVGCHVVRAAEREPLTCALPSTRRGTGARQREVQTHRLRRHRHKVRATMRVRRRQPRRHRALVRHQRTAL